MSPERWKRITGIFHAALARDAAARGSLLDQMCGDDASLRAEVDAMLAAHRDAGSFGDEAVAPPEEARRLEPGDVLGPYRIEALIGQGGMGEVYRARDTRLERNVALKVLPVHAAGDTERRERLAREGKALAALSHPHICPVFDVGRQDGIDYLVMEHVDGVTLAARLSKGPLPLEQALRYAVEIADALDKAHRAAVVHRDLKPANVILTKGGVKLIDFGVARLRAAAQAPVEPGEEAPSPLTGHGSIVGTLQYMSPEQLNGQEADARSDVFALGALIHEMVTGAKAFDGGSRDSVVAAILERDPPPLSSLQPASPPALDHLVRTCLAKDPDRRWQSAGDVGRQLEYLWTTEGRAGAGSPAGPWRRPAAVLAAAAVLVALAAAAVRNLGPAPSAARRVSRFDYQLPPGQEFRNANRPVLAMSPDGRRFVYNTTAGLYVRALEESEAHPVPGTEDDVAGPFFSPDGKWVGYFAGGHLKKIAVGGGAPIALCEAENPFGAHWGGDGTVVFAEPKGIRRVSASGGIPELLLPARAGETWYGPQLLPGGEWLLLTVARATEFDRWDRAEIVAQSVRTSERRVLWTGGSDARYLPTGHLVFAVKDTLYAIAFDPVQVEVSGAPVPMARGVHRPVQLSMNPGYASYGVSDDGTLVHVRAVGSGKDRVLAFVDREGRVGRLDMTPGPYANPRLSPDGKRVALQTLDEDTYTGDIWIHDLEGGRQLRQLTAGGASMWPVWSPDGTRVVYTSDRDGPECLYVQPVDGGPAQRLTACDASETQRPDSWSAVGPTLAFRKNPIREGKVRDAGIFTLGAGRTAVAELFHDVPGSSQYEAVFSPDGKWIAYTSNETGRDEIFIQPFPATGARVRATHGGGCWPLWSPDGREIIYRRSFDAQLYRSGGVRLFSVSVTTRGGLGVGPERVLPVHGFLVFNTFRDYDFSKDGRLLLVYPADPAPGGPRINVVQNWFEELKARVPAP